MAGYRIISDVTGELLKRTRDALCPELLPNPEQVAAGAPDNKDNEALLNICLYSMRQYTDYLPERQVSADGYSVDRPYVLVLDYVLFFSRHAQSPLDPLAEQQCLGKLLERFSCAPALDPVQFHAAADSWDEPASIILPKLERQQERELWTGFSEPLRPAIYLEIAPLLLGGTRAGSARVRKFEGEVSRR